MVCVSAGVGCPFQPVLPDAVAHCPETSSQEHDQASEDKYFAAIQIIDCSAVQVGIGEDAVDEYQHSGDINQEVKQLPSVPSKFLAKVRGKNHDDQEVKADCSDRVLEWLQRRMNRENNVDETKAIAIHNKEYQWMNHNRREQQISGPVVKRKNVEASMRPEANRTITNCN